MICSQCGNPVEESASFCPKCGHAMSAADYAPQQPNFSDNSQQADNNGGYQQDRYQQNGYQQYGYQQDGYQQYGYQQDGYQQSGYQPEGYQQYGEKPGLSYAIASLVLGINGLVFAGFGGFVLGIIGLIMAYVAKSKGYVGGMRKAGFVCSLIALILGALMLIFWVNFFSALSSAISAYSYYYY